MPVYTRQPCDVLLSLSLSLLSYVAHFQKDVSSQLLMSDGFYQTVAAINE